MEGWSIVLLLSWFMTATEIDTRTVKDIDLNRYMGVWYEIARMDHRFERGLVGATAEYTLKANGKIRVVNRGYKEKLDGKLKTAKGKAYMPDPAVPGKLRVSFFPFIYSDYYILELEPENYEWVLIGSSSPQYLWILSRTPQLPAETISRILTRARARGYHVDTLLFPAQPEIGSQEKVTLRRARKG